MQGSVLRMFLDKAHVAEILHQRHDPDMVPAGKAGKLLHLFHREKPRSACFCLGGDLGKSVLIRLN